MDILRAMRLAVVVGGVVVASMVASAQPAKDPTQIAAQYAEAGTVALKGGDPETAVDMFEKANALVPTPEFLYDIALSHRKASITLKAQDAAKAATHRDAAREYFRKFLDTKPQSEDLELKAQGYLAKLDQQWAEEHPKEEAARRAEEDRKREEATRAEQARIAEERHKKEERDRLERERIAKAVTQTRYDSEMSKVRIVKISGFAALGGGAIATGLGIYFGIHARSLGDQLTHSNTYDQSVANDGRQADRYMAISYAAGGVLLVGGAVTTWIGYRMDSRVENLVVTPTAGGAAVGFGGRF